MIPQSPAARKPKIPKIPARDKRGPIPVRSASAPYQSVAASATAPAGGLTAGGAALVAARKGYERDVRLETRDVRPRDFANV